VSALDCVFDAVNCVDPSIAEARCGKFAFQAGTAITLGISNAIKGDMGVSSPDFIAPFEVKNCEDTEFTRTKPVPLPQMGGKTFVPGSHSSGTLDMAAASKVILD
jgi:hypothetical protein